MIDGDMEEYVDYLRNYHDGIEELVVHDLTQPFRASYDAYSRYGREGLPEKTQMRSLYLSKSYFLQEAIELRREYEGEPDQEVLQRILYDYFQLEQPSISREKYYV